MANSKKTPPKKKTSSPRKKSTNNKPLIIAGIVIIIIGIIFYIFLYRDKFKSKVEDMSPPAFNYPTTYEEYVLKYSKTYKVDPVLIFSVIRVESNFNPKAESDVGARGLMQIMSDAYDWIKFRTNDNKSKSFDDMYDPETNIKYGSYYLSYLMDKYDNSIELTAAAYHCGMGLVDGWLADGTVKKDDFRVEDIPDENDQTAHYVNKIDKAYSSYKEILSNQNINNSKKS